MNQRISESVSVLVLLVLSVLSSTAQTITTAEIAVTNTAGTTNGQTVAVNSNTRTWTNNVVVSASQILTNSTADGAATNMFNQFSVNPFTGLALSWGSSTSVVLRSFPGQAITVALSAGWGSVTYTTNTLTSARVVRTPMTVETAGPRAEIASQLITGLNDYSTNSLSENAITVSNLMGRTNSQIIPGAKQMTNTTGNWAGGITNSPGINGNFGSVSNGHWWSGNLHAPSLTNGANYGNAFRSPGSGTASEQFGTSASATGTRAVAIGFGSAATDTETTAIGDSAFAAEPQGIAIGSSATAAHTNAVAIGAFSISQAADQIRLGTSSHHVSIPGGLFVEGSITNPATVGTNTVDGHIKFIRYAVSTLANGNNAAVPISTNTFVEVSGPSGAFTINGIANGTDGRFLIILNQTGQDMTIAHQSGTDPTAGNRIITMTGADRSTTANGAVQLIYSAAASRWILISLDP